MELLLTWASAGKPSVAYIPFRGTKRGLWLNMNMKREWWTGGLVGPRSIRPVVESPGCSCIVRVWRDKPTIENRCQIRNARCSRNHDHLDVVWGSAIHAGHRSFPDLRAAAGLKQKTSEDVCYVSAWLRPSSPGPRSKCTPTQ